MKLFQQNDADSVLSFLSLFGLFFIGVGSMGNSYESRRWCPTIIGFTVVFLMVTIPRFSRKEVRGKGYLNNASIVLGLIVCVFHISNLTVFVLKPQAIERRPLLKRLLRSSLLANERQLKHAGAHKINLMTRNALKMLGENERSGVLATHFGRGLHNFAVGGETFEKCGGFKYTWTRIFDNTIVRDFGIWYSSRLISSNIAQYIVCIYVLIAGINLTKTAMRSFDNGTALQTVSAYAGYAVQTTASEEMVKSVIANVTGLIGGYVGSNSNGMGRNCSNSFNESLLASACQYTYGAFNCDPNTGIDFSCAFANSTNWTEGDLSMQLGLLQASGFDVEAMTAALQTALNEAAETSTHTLYPSSKYM